MVVPAVVAWQAAVVHNSWKAAQYLMQCSGSTNGVCSRLYPASICTHQVLSPNLLCLILKRFLLLHLVVNSKTDHSPCWSRSSPCSVWMQPDTPNASMTVNGCNQLAWRPPHPPVGYRKCWHVLVHTVGVHSASSNMLTGCTAAQQTAVTVKEGRNVDKLHPVTYA